MAMAPPSDDNGGRPNLPGIPGYIDRVSAECIWKTNCNAETEYLRHRNKNPPKAREHYGALHGFEVVRYPTYVSARRLPTDLASNAPSVYDGDDRSVCGSNAGGELRRCGSAGGISAAGSGRGAERSRSSLAELPPEMNHQAISNDMHPMASLKAVMASPMKLNGTPKVIPVPMTKMVIPKYGRFQGDHMKALEVEAVHNPNCSLSAKSLRRVLSTGSVANNMRKGR